MRDQMAEKWIRAEGNGRRKGRRQGDQIILVEEGGREGGREEKNRCRFQLGWLQWEMDGW